MFGKRGIGVALSSLALLGASVVTAQGARAHEGPIGCTGQENTSYTPGLSLTQRPTAVVANGAYTCTGAPGRTVAATTRIEATSPSTGCVHLGVLRAEETVRYGDGRTSVISYTTGRSTRALGLNTVRLEGVVVKGLGRGGRAERVIQTAPAGLPTECLTPGGLREVTAFVQLRILP
ncbi:hypothetical protein [Streptomyces griseocarneus]|uniref:hypothetical protein n=1 Tax=Streptomyces griseocarneus TaxID=51201 RepID=UPI00167D78AF|nr:hypothetical protein [Streptomyces griseocarneus]MBZ6474214.1 hypothetical protein [Streptomyces griseocarneus]GHG52644.1 hypothetical protein GCM10018779_14060 [Streptomyces griseocarneus]